MLATVDVDQLLVRKLNLWYHFMILNEKETETKKRKLETQITLYFILYDLYFTLYIQHYLLRVFLRQLHRPFSPQNYGDSNLSSLLLIVSSVWYLQMIRKMNSLVLALPTSHCPAPKVETSPGPTSIMLIGPRKGSCRTLLKQTRLLLRSLRCTRSKQTMKKKPDGKAEELHAPVI